MQHLPNAIQEAGGSDILPEDSFFQSLSDQEEKVVEILEKQDLSQRNLAAVIESLEFANDRLQVTMHRIGYLEAKVEGLEERLLILPELKSIAARYPLLEMENQELKTILIERETQLAESEAELRQASLILDHVRASLWHRFWAWLTATSI